ncbi:Syntaxin-22 [Dactylella cylindrospora]|nr:Syntaxin-22 [Dactylella cylindrospora]
MSFARLPSLEAQPTTSRETGYSDDPEFHRLTQSLSSRLFNLTSNITKANHILSLLGTKKDSQDTRDRLKKLLDETREGFKEIGEGVKKVQLWENVSPQQRFIQEKLSREFTAALPDFQAVQKLSIEKQRQYVLQARHALEALESSEPGSPSADAMPLVQQQTAQLQLASQSDVDFQESLIQEREEEIRDIEEGITQLNEIFRDLGTMVQEQGQMVGRVWHNVDNTRTDTRAASRELTTAARHQKNARNRACCLLLILSVVLLVILLAIFV